MIEARIKELLLANQPVKDIIGKRITPVVLRQETELPCLVYRRIGSKGEYTLAGRSGWRTVTLQVMCWCVDYGHARELAEAVRKALDAYSELDTEGSIRFIAVEDGPDDYVEVRDAFGAMVMLAIDYDDEAVTL